MLTYSVEKLDDVEDADGEVQYRPDDIDGDRRPAGVNDWRAAVQTEDPVAVERDDVVQAGAKQRNADAECSFENFRPSLVPLRGASSGVLRVEELA